MEASGVGLVGREHELAAVEEFAGGGSGARGLVIQGVAGITDGRLRLIATVAQQVPASVPGLPDPADLADPGFSRAPGPTPTIVQCVRAWNGGAPRATLQWIGTLKAYGAQITGDTFASGPECDIFVYFGDEQDVLVSGTWKNGAVSGWLGDIGGNLPLSKSSQNATVAADGTFHLH